MPVRMLHEAASCEPDDTRFALLVTLRAQGGYGRSMVLWFASVSTLSWFLLDAFPEVFCGEDATEELTENLGSLMPVLREEGLTQAVWRSSTSTRVPGPRWSGWARSMTCVLPTPSPQRRSSSGSARIAGRTGMSLSPRRNGGIWPSS